MTSRPFSSMITVFYLYLIILLITLVDYLPFYTQGKVVNITLTLSQNDVSPDGVVRLAKVINGSIPGPTIEAFVGDELSVTVRNRFYIEGASIHWHGLHQRGTNFFDGVDGVTQCPIPHGTDFTYRFKLDCAGTYWYHGHTGFQAAEGLSGPLIIHKRREDDPIAEMYGPSTASSNNDTGTDNENAGTAGDDESLHAYEHVMFMQDWDHGDPLDAYLALINNKAESSDNPWSDLPWVSVLVNGKGRYEPQDKSNAMNMDMDMDMDMGMDMNMDMDMDMGDTGKRNAKKDTQSNGEGGDSTVRLEQFEVEAGSKYRFRLINGAATWAFRVSIEGHSLQLVGLDGADVNATAAVDKVIVNIGERCDLVVHADQPVRNYWIFIESLNGKHISHAILHYTGAETKTLITKQQTMSSSSSSLTYAVDPAPASPLPTKKAVTFDPSVYPNIVTPYPPPGPLPPSSPLASYPPSPVVPATSDYTHTLNLGGNMDTYVWSINGQSFKYPTTPFIFSKGSFDTHSSTQFIDIELNSVIDLVINNPTMMIHPMHLHGHSAWVMATSASHSQSSGTMDMNMGEMDGEMGAMSDMMGKFTPFSLDADGGKLNTKDPIMKDTIGVPAGGWVVLRFYADNPGAWFFHCHVDTHLMAGMALIFNEGSTEYPALPHGFPLCGGTVGYHTHPGIACSLDDDGDGIAEYVSRGRATSMMTLAASLGAASAFVLVGIVYCVAIRFVNIEYDTRGKLHFETKWPFYSNSNSNSNSNSSNYGSGHSGRGRGREGSNGTHGDEHDDDDSDFSLAINRMTSASDDHYGNGLNSLHLDGSRCALDAVDSDASGGSERQVKMELLGQ